MKLHVVVAGVAAVVVVVVAAVAVVAAVVAGYGSEAEGEMQIKV